MLYILDTDHISLVQRQDANVIHRIQQLPVEQRAVTIITIAEQVQGRQARIRRAKSEYEAGRAFRLFAQTIDFYRSIHVLPYDQAAVTEFERLRRAKIRIGTQDLRIAAIAITANATVVTRNLRDFTRVPDLRTENWS